MLYFALIMAQIPTVPGRLRTRIFCNNPWPRSLYNTSSRW
jgi:hypothetical protein